MKMGKIGKSRFRGFWAKIGNPKFGQKMAKILKFRFLGTLGKMDLGQNPKKIGYFSLRDCRFLKNGLTSGSRSSLHSILG